MEDEIQRMTDEIKELKRQVHKHRVALRSIHNSLMVAVPALHKALERSSILEEIKIAIAEEDIQ